MPKYVIERQYLVPMYQHIVVEAETLDAACEMAVSDDIAWDTQEMDSDNARKTTPTVVKEVPADYDADQAHSLIIARVARFRPRHAILRRPPAAAAGVNSGRADAGGRCSAASSAAVTTSLSQGPTRRLAQPLLVLYRETESSASFRSVPLRELRRGATIA
jgi:hypothetical protein